MITVISVFFAIVGMIALLWLERGIIGEFLCARSGTTTGMMALFANYVLSAWIGSVFGLLFPVIGLSTSQRVYIWAVIGILIASLLRLHTLTGAIAGDKNRRSSLIVESFITLAIPASFAVIICVAGVLGDSNQLLRQAPTDNSSFDGREKIGLLLILGSLAAALVVEVLWEGWKRIPTNNANLQYFAISAAKRVLASNVGAQAIELYGNMHEIAPTRIQIEIHDPENDDHLAEMIDMLISEGLVIRVSSDSVRPNPEMISRNRDFCRRRIVELSSFHSLTNEEVEAMLHFIQTKRMPEALLSKLSFIGSGDDLERPSGLLKLMEIARDRIPLTVTGPRGRAYVNYLRLRYWEGRTMEETSAALGYRREHVRRNYHADALKALKDALASGPLL